MGHTDKGNEYCLFHVSANIQQSKTDLKVLLVVSIVSLRIEDLLDVVAIHESVMVVALASPLHNTSLSMGALANLGVLETEFLNE